MQRKKDNKNDRNWSGRVTKYSNALDLEKDIFIWKNPKKIAQSLKRSAETSTRKKGSSYQSAMSMLNFYINRAGRKLSNSQKNILECAKRELQILFNKK